MKIALCFLISHSNTLNKEELWKKWIAPNKDIINIYFHYKQNIHISSEWISDHAVPPQYIVPTTYLHVVHAYLSILQYALEADLRNTWFCFLTESCVPIISPKKFRRLFYKNYKYSIMKWSEAWWNTQFHRRANLNLLSKDFRLANDPWFILKRDHALSCLQYKENRITKKSFSTICCGGLANESIFAIIFKTYNLLSNKNASTHLTDWTRMESGTSPHLFKTYDKEVDQPILDKLYRENPYACFLRKVHPEFPDEVLNKMIYKKEKQERTWFSLLFEFLWDLFISFYYYF